MDVTEEGDDKITIIHVNVTNERILILVAQL